MEKEKPRLCIATLDPLNRGGVLSMAEFIYFHSKNKYKPSLVYNVLPSLRTELSDLSFAKFIFGATPKIIKETVLGMNGIGIQRVFPLFEFLNYVLNLGQWNAALKEFDIFFAAGGSNHAATSFALSGKDFSIWVASMLYEDRIDRIKKEQLLRKIRDYISLPFLLFFERIIYKKAKKIFAVSNYTRKKIVKAYPFVSGKIETLFFPIDSDYFTPGEESNTSKYILFTGRISDDRKNITLLVKAFSLLPLEFKDIKLKLVGGSPSEELIDLCKKLGVNDRVEFPDYLDRQGLLRAYQGASLFVIPSFQEGLCISGLEAMSCRVPVISTKCGGPEDFIVDGVNGFLCENDNVNDMAEKITNFFKMGDEKRKKFGIEARDFVLRNHNQQKIWDRCEFVINNGKA